MNINTKNYWEKRFSTDDWARKGGNKQSYEHANRYAKLLNIPSNFKGSICDFGCAEGNSFIVYRKIWPYAQLQGVDFSTSAIKTAHKRNGSLGEFICGDQSEVLNTDIIISAHTLEHMEDNIELIGYFLKRCKKLFIVVPYKEQPLGKEHLRAYNEESFTQLKPKNWSITDAGWQFNTSELLYRVYLKNIIRFFIRKPIVRMPQQIIFEFSGLL